ncbi:MAG TPA: hypothetical protein VGL89_01195 [Candidatus Koribacter sp.]
MSNAAPSRLATVRGTLWIRRRWWLFLLTSSALLIPCFWHAEIGACDLNSHLYNAWLSQSVAQGLLPGLHFEPKHTNILVDVLLAQILPYFGAAGTERVVAGFGVLLVFWGAFALSSAAANAPPWRVAPLLAMVSYGSIFYWGFLNFYISAGFSLFALALIAGGSLWEWPLVVILFGLAAMAHPFGAACLVALGTYLAIARFVSVRSRLLLTALFLIAAFLVRWYAVYHYSVLPRSVPYFYLLGADQFIVFGPAFLAIAVAALILSLVVVLLRRRDIRRSQWLLFYLMIAITVACSPGGLYSDERFGMMGFLPDRGSLYSVVALAVLLAACRPPRWTTVAWCALAFAYFIGIYRDTGILNRRLDKVNALVAQAKPSRVIAVVPGLPGSRIREDHTVERACIGRCYVWNNYEPSTYQFRLIAEPGNHVVDMDQDALDSMTDGAYTVQPSDLPLNEIYQCGSGAMDLCLAHLNVGQRNGDVAGFIPKP